LPRRPVCEKIVALESSILKYMTEFPSYPRDRAWRASLAVLLLAVLFGFHAPLASMFHEWTTKADYSHGLLVAPFAIYLLWTRREKIPRQAEWPDWYGLIFIVVGVALSVVAGTLNKAKEISQGVGLILALAGVVAMMFGRYGLRWAWPGLAFLIFMVKMPDVFERQFAFKLRQISAHGSNFILQILGYPSFVGGSQGTIVTINDHPIDIAWACSGLSMLLTFVAVAAAFAMLIHRPILDRVLLFVSSVPVAVLANILRITVTALVYNAGWKQLGNAIVHDLAGWLMMPLAILFLWIEMKVLDWLFTTPAPPERDDIVKMAAQTAAAEWLMPPEGPPAADRKGAGR
jgi:exosortase